MLISLVVESSVMLSNSPLMHKIYSLHTLIMQKEKWLMEGGMPMRAIMDQSLPRM